MVVYFITGNSKKFEEASQIIQGIEKLDIDLPEIQELDPRKIIEEKLKEARKNHSGEFFCEDTSVYLECLNGFPGPLIKWFKKSIEIDGIYCLVSKYENNNAVAKTIIGYSKGEEINFFEGEIKGKIVSPRGKRDFGWDPIFQPNGHDKTMAEMTLEEKNKISMRKQALEKLNEYLKK
ncbi:MAG: non-canonical purine NTP pyrophosphatase [Candidatus Pacearchaeota archaeon]|jgi:non-canonical purine NTP pyrophosphatase (RdgB/HAM1 family)